MDLERAQKFKEIFSGSKNQNVEAFLDRFDRWCTNQNHGNDYKTRNFILCLDGEAFTAYKSLPAEIKNDYNALRRQLIEYYAPTCLPSDEQYERINNMKMKRTDSVQSFFNQVMEKAENLDMSLDQKRVIFKNGLPKYIKKYIKQEKPATIWETLKRAKQAEELGADHDENDDLKELKESIKILMTKIDSTQSIKPVAAVAAAMPVHRCMFCNESGHAMINCHKYHQGLNPIHNSYAYSETLPQDAQKYDF